MARFNDGDKNTIHDDHKSLFVNFELLKSQVSEKLITVFLSRNATSSMIILIFSEILWKIWWNHDTWRVSLTSISREVLTVVFHVSRFLFRRYELPWYASRSQTRIIHMDLKQRVCHIENASCALFTFCLASDRIGPRYYTIRGSIPVVDGSVIFVFLEWLWNRNPDLNPS